MSAGKFWWALSVDLIDWALYVRLSLTHREPVPFPGELFQDSRIPQETEGPSKIDALGGVAEPSR